MGKEERKERKRGRRGEKKEAVSPAKVASQLASSPSLHIE